MSAFADYYDGQSAVRRRVSLRIDGDALLLERPEDTSLRWRLSDLRRLPDRAPGGLVVVAPRTGAERLIAGGDVGEHLRRLVPQARPDAGRSLLAATVFTMLGGAAFLAVLFFLALPLMAGVFARIMNPDAEVALGAIHEEQARLYFGGGQPIQDCRDPAGLAALDALTARVAEGLDLPYDLRVAVVDDRDNPILNAYALAGGRVFFFGTMIQEAEHPDEIAAVLAHEIGHVVNRDPVRIQLQQMSGLAIVTLLLGDITGGGLISSTASSALVASYSRTAEEAADDFAVAQLTRVGLPPSALGRMFERLRERYGDTAGLVAHFSTHPQTAGRIAAVTEAGDPVIGAPALTPKEWAALQAICD